MTPTKPVHTVLVVEDDDITRAGFGEVLSEHGYRVALVPNRREALDYLRDYPEPDLIILDMFMPGMDGWRFLKDRGFHWTSIPVIITTAFGSASEGWAHSLGVADVVRKPVDLEIFLKRVEKCLTN